MPYYTLLRKNRESGPYVLRDLKEKGLFPDDLIWVEGESTAWSNPDEIKELVPFVGKAKREPEFSFQHNQNTSQIEPTGLSEANENPSFESLKEKYSTRYPVPKRRPILNIMSMAFGLGVAVVSIGLLSYVAKQMVEGFNSPALEATAVAKEIGAVHLPTSTTAHAALGATATPVSATNYVVIDSAELKSAETVPNKAIVKSAPVKRENAIGTASDVANEKLLSKAEETAPPIEEAAHKKDSVTATSVAKKEKPTLKARANEYSVGMFGGIKDLSITVSNPSAQTADDYILEVDYLKPNGEVAKTVRVPVPLLAGNASVPLALPDQSRGVSVRYAVRSGSGTNR